MVICDRCGAKVNGTNGDLWENNFVIVSLTRFESTKVIKSYEICRDCYLKFHNAKNDFIESFITGGNNNDEQ